LGLLTRVLQTQTSDYWQATDPDVLLAIHIDQRFPFLNEKRRLVYETLEVVSKRRARDAARKEQGLLPDDTVEFLLFVDVYNFAGAGAYQDEGLCFRFLPSWLQLGEFREALKAEYFAFAAKRGIDAFNSETYGADWVPPQY